MRWSEANEAIQDARQTIEAADRHVGEMLAICVGRLRKSGASVYTLSALKRELQAWDMHRKEWKP